MITQMYDVTREEIIHGVRHLTERVLVDASNPWTGDGPSDRTDVEIAVMNAQHTGETGVRFAWSEDGILTITSAGCADATAEEWTLIVTARPVQS